MAQRSSPDEVEDDAVPAPKRASKARTDPTGATTRALSPMAEPTMTVSPTITGGDVI